MKKLITALLASALIFTANADYGIGLYGSANGAIYASYGVFSPLDLIPLQWLYIEQNPEVIDKTANALDADYVDAYCTTLDGVGDHCSVPYAVENSLGELELARPDSGDMASHQGCAASDTYIWTFDTAKLYKRSRTAPYEEITSNDDPFSDIATVSHLGDGCYLNGKIYITMEYWSGTSSTDEYIAVFDAETLVRDAVYDISAQGHEASGVGTDGTHLYVTSYLDGSKIWKYTTAGVFVESISLDKTILQVQGVTITDGEMYLASNSRGIYVFNMAGEFQRQCAFQNLDEAYIFEGLDFTQPDINIQMRSGTGLIRFYNLDQKHLSGWGITATVIPDDVTAERVVVSKYLFSLNRRQYDLYFQSGLARFRVGGSDGGEGLARASIVASAGSPVTLKCGYDTIANNVYITDGTNANQVAYASTYKTFEDQMLIGGLDPSAVLAPFDGQIIEVITFNTIDGADVVSSHYTFSEGWSTTSYDVSGNGNHGTWTTGLGGEATLWGTPQSINAANAERGFSKVLSFDGTANCYAGYDTGSTDSGYFGACSIKSGVIFNALGTLQVVHSHGSGGYRLYASASSTWVLNTTDTGVSLSANTFYDTEVVFDSSGQAVELKVNDASVWTGTASAGSPVGVSDFQVGARSGGLNLNGFIKYCYIVGGNDPHTWDARDGYDSVIPNGLASANLTLNGAATFKAIPANSAGNDVLGLGLTNPACGEDRIWNNFEGSIQQKAANTEFLDNPFWSADGINYDKKGMADFIAHLNFDNNVVINRPNSWSVKEILTWLISKNWPPSEYIRMINWLAAQGSVQDGLGPLTDIDEEYILDSNGNLIFPAP